MNCICFGIHDLKLHKTKTNVSDQNEYTSDLKRNKSIIQYYEKKKLSQTENRMFELKTYLKF